jgi:hypothetical protein
MKEMFEASVDGDAFDMEKWGQYFKPNGYNNKSAPASNPVESAPTSAPAQDIDADDEPASTPTATAAPAGDAGSRAQDILAMIRNRQKSE